MIRLTETKINAELAKTNRRMAENKWIIIKFKKKVNIYALKKNKHSK